MPKALGLTLSTIFAYGFSFVIGINAVAEGGLSGAFTDGQALQLKYDLFRLEDTKTLKNIDGIGIKSDGSVRDEFLKKYTIIEGGLKDVEGPAIPRLLDGPEYLPASGSGFVRTFNLENPNSVRFNPGSLALTEATNSKCAKAAKSLRSQMNKTINPELKYVQKYDDECLSKITPDTLDKHSVDKAVGFFVLNSKSPICTGVRVTQNIVVTARHCFYEKKDNSPRYTLDEAAKGSLKFHLLASLDSGLVITKVEDNNYFSQQKLSTRIPTNNDYVFVHVNIPTPMPPIEIGRAESDKTIVAGSWSEDDLINDITALLEGKTVQVIEFFSRLPEISIKLSEGMWFSSYATAEGGPEWGIRFLDNSWLSFKDGDFIVENSDGQE